MPTGDLTLTFNLKLYNANNMLLKELKDNDNISVAFDDNIRDYAKYKIFLQAGERLEISKPSTTNIRLKLINHLGIAKVQNTGLTLIYKAEQQGDYYLFIDNRKGHGGSYTGRASISSASSRRSKKNNHIVYDNADPALP